MRNQFLNITIGFLLLVLLPCALQGQNRNSDRFSFEFKGEPLTEVLQTVAEKTGIDMVYDPKIANGHHVYERIQHQSVSEILKQILKGSPLDYLTLSSGTIVIVEKIREAPSRGSLYGRVVDRSTGEPLPGASVMLADASGGTSAGPSGTFTLNRMVSGSYKIIFSYVGYEPVAKTVTIKPNRQVREKVGLKPKPVNFTPIVVTGHRPQIPPGTVPTLSIRPNNPWEPSAGPMYDAVRSLSLFPGIQNGLSIMDLHLQGSRQGEHQIQLDGVPVYNPHSFGQMFSSFSPFAIHKIEVNKAGFGVSEGSQIAGLVNLHHDVNGISQNEAIFQVDPLSVNLRGDLYFPLNDSDEDESLKLMTAVRSNYWDLYRPPTLNRTLREWDDLDPLITGLLISSNEDPSLYNPVEHQSDVRFHDIHLASVYSIDTYKTLSASVYLGENSVNTGLLNQAPPRENLPEYLFARDEYHWNNAMSQLSWNQQISPRFEFRTRLSYTSSRLRNRYLIGTSNNGTIPDGNLTVGNVYANFESAGAQNRLPTQHNTNRIKHFIFRSDGSYHFNPKFNFAGGIQVDVVNSRINFSDLFYLPTLSDQQSTLLSSYLNGNWTAGNFWKFTAGNRLTYENSSGRLYTEPRASIQYDQPDSKIGYWTARLAGGLYRQFINQYEITNPGPTSLVPSLSVWSHASTSQKPKAWHLSGSIHLQPSERTSLKIESYYKWHPATYTVSYENLLDGIAENRSSFSAFAQSTSKKSFGTGLRLNQSLSNSKLQLMFGYDYSFNRINLDKQFGRALPPPWNQPHRLQFRTLWRITPGLSAVAKWQSIFGRTWGFRPAYYNYLFLRDQGPVDGFSFATPGDDRLPAFHQLDISLIYKPAISFMDLELRMDLININDRENTLDRSLQRPNSNSNYQIRERTMSGFNPSLSIKVSY